MTDERNYYKEVAVGAASGAAAMAAVNAGVGIVGTLIRFLAVPENREALNEWYYKTLAPKEGQTLVWK